MNRIGVAALAVALAASGCGGRGKPDPPVRPSASATASPQATPDVSFSPSAPIPEPSPSMPPGPSPGPPVVKPAPPPKPVPPPAPVDATGPARPGQYLFDDKGQIKTLGCLTRNQPVPSPSRLIVGPPSGPRQQIDREQNGEGGAGFVTNALFEYRPDGVYLVSVRQRQTFSNQTVDIQFVADAPVLAIPARPVPGQTGSFTLSSTDGRVQARTDFRVEGVNESVTLGQGAVVTATRILTGTRITGQSDQGTLDVLITRTSWYSPQSRLEVKDQTRTEGTVGLCRVEFSVESLARAV